MIAVLHRICAPAFAVALVAGLSVATVSSAYATQPAKGQSTTHLVYCQETGNHWTITKGDNPSDNKNRTQVGTWNEHERGEGWNQARAEQEFLSKCNVASVPATPVTPTETPKPGMGNATPAPVASAVTTPTAPKPVATISAAVTELPQTGSFGATAIILGLITTIAAYGITYVLQSKQS